MIIFDTLAYAKKLKDAGFTDIQAEVQAEGLAQILETNIATKKDIADVHKDIQDVRKDIEQLRTDTGKDIQDVRQDIAQLRIDTGKDIQEMGYKLTIRMGIMLAAVVTLLSAMKFFD